MRTKEILVIGAGIAGCAIALALAKRGIAVTIMTSPLDQRICSTSFIRHQCLEEKIQKLSIEKPEQFGCPRAYEQLVTLASQSLKELLESNYLVDRNGNIDIQRCLQEQLKQYAEVEWYSHYSVIELLTLDQHSQRKADRYKKPTCLGVIAYNHDTQRIEYFLAKETILATGGAPSLFPYSIYPSTACGEGIAIAYRAGARLLNMDQIQFHPLALFERERPSFPLPLELLAEGAKIYVSKAALLEVDFSSSSYLLHQLYDQLLKTHHEHLWLDLTLVDHIAFKEKFPTVDNYCLNHGFNFVKDPLPVVPAVVYTYGGIAIDRTAQTTLQRLRAIGGVACTGLFWNFGDETLSVLESLTWAMVCAEDIAKQVNKFIYYFPEVREGPSHLGASSSIVEEDWKMLRQIMWSYIGIHHDRPHLERGCLLLDQLSIMNTPSDLFSCSIEQIQLCYAIQTAQLIAYAIRAQQGKSTYSARFPSFFQRLAHESPKAVPI